MCGVNRRLRDLGQGMIDSTWKANEDFFHEVILDQTVNDEKASSLQEKSIMFTHLSTQRSNSSN